MNIPFSRPSITDDEVAEVVACLRSGWITTGPRTAQFEKEFAAAVQSPQALAVSSATAGLHLAMLGLDLQPGDEVVTTPLTWPATVNTIVLAGARPVLVDIEADTLNLDASRVEAALSPRTRAIVPVHFAGQPCDLDALSAIAQPRGIRIVEDAAHALGTAYRDRPIGSGDVAVFSFHPIKNITTGEGGMITTADAELARRLRLLRFHGVERDAWKAYGGAQLPLYDVGAPGLKYNLTDLQSAIGIHQLRRLASLNAERKRLARRYAAALADLPLRPLGRVPYPHRHSHHLYVVRLALDELRVDRNTFMAQVIEAGVGLGLHFTAVHELTYYRRLLGDLHDALPVATDASQRLFSLPLFPGLSDAEQDRVVEVLRETVRRNRR